MDFTDRIKIFDAQIAEQKAAIRQLKVTRKNEGDDTRKAYLDKLIISVRESISFTKKQRGKIAKPDSPRAQKRRGRILVIAGALHLSMRDHLPKEFDPVVMLRAAEAVADAIISDSSRKAVGARPDRIKSKENAKALRAAWATGKYPTKRNCAMKAGRDLGMKPEAALKALQGAPKPIKRRLRVEAN